jgi:hypothetical protein
MFVLEKPVEKRFSSFDETSLKIFSYWWDRPSMYDFVNIFTEHAKELPNGQKIEVKARAGSLADWIAENKRKFA